MRSLERVRALIAGQPVDHLPVQPVIMMFAARHLGIPFIDYTRDGRKMAAAQSKLVHDFGIDCLLTCSDPAREVIDIAGEGSINWYEDQGPAICEERAALLDKTRLKTFHVPDPLGTGRMHDRIMAIEIMHQEFGGEVSIVGWVEGPLALAAELRGLTRSMMDFLDDPAFMKDLLDFTAEVAIVYAEAEIQSGADTIGMSDAAASMMGPKYYRELLFPRQLRVVDSIRQAHPEVIVRLHMCGNTDPLIAQMKQLPVQIFELDSPTNLAAARACLGPDRVILGNVSTITDMLEGSPEHVYEASRRCHQICGKFHIVGTGCEVPPATPPENLHAMVRYSRSTGRRSSEPPPPPDPLPIHVLPAPWAGAKNCGSAKPVPIKAEEAAPMAFIVNRRTFLKNSAFWITASPALPGLGGAPPGLQTPGEAGAQPETLEGGFLEPSDAFRPWVLWIASDGTLTREGITADLEAMHRVGIRGVFFYEVNLFVPKGPVGFMTAQWRELIQHAGKEATRLGITMAVQNDGGYTGSGGPWITPELSMQMVVSSETTLEGPRHFAGTLPQPLKIQNYYEDIVVLAFPTLAADRVQMAEQHPTLTSGLERKSFDSAALVGGNPGAVSSVPRAAAGQPQYLNIDFPEPFTAQALSVALEPWNSQIDGALEVSEDGERYRTIREFPLRWPRSSVNFPRVTSRHYRLLLRTGDEEFNWLFRAFSKGIPLGEVQLHSGPRIEDIPGKAAYIRQEGFSGEPEMPPEMVLRRDQILDLSGKMDRDGRLDWDVPSGKWTVLRMGHTSTGKTNHPAPVESLGLECDKLSKKAIEVHFANFLEKLVADQSAVGGKALKMAHVDSWETGSQNWTPEFRREFHKRRGYDALTFLPVLTGRAVESSEVSERFLWDLRRTIGDLLLENYAGHLRELSHQHGLTLSIEGYGSGPYDDVAYGACADVPMCEMWTGVPQWWDQLLTYCKEMASSAHVYGRPILASETFTAEPENAKWQNHPFRLKPIADLVFSLGVNRIAITCYSMQPWLDRKPGMTMGPFGIQYERTNTWWEHTRPWHTYLARCQHLLQRGQFVADVAYLGSENVPQSYSRREWLDPAIPAGYDFDVIPPEALFRYATVRDGRLVLATGMCYRLLVLPPGRAMTPALLGKIKDLVEAGLTAVGPRPTRSPSLADYPHGDAQVQGLAAELWGNCDGASVTENRCGQGRVVWGRPLADVLAGMGAPPDFACHDLTVGEQIRYVHRQIDGDDLYFVANAMPEARSFLCMFRVTGMRPELWWPDTGRIEPVAVWDERDGRTLIPLTLDPCGSVFVFFRGAAPPFADRVVSLRHDGVELSGLAPAVVPEIQLLQEEGAITVHRAATGEYLIEVAQPGSYEFKTAAGPTLKATVPEVPHAIEIEGPWELEFPEGWGAPPRVTLARLISWTEHPDSGVKYFSGTATYRRRFDLPASILGRDRRLYLDLGHVAVIAQAKLNGHDLGVLWKPPFRADITEIIQAGMNDLAVSVVNLWPNRLIGDDHLPADCEWVLPSTPRNPTPHTWGAVLDHWPQWLLEDKPSPTGRLTFTTWKHWSKDDPLLESGLLGPVRICTNIYCGSFEMK